MQFRPFVLEAMASYTIILQNNATKYWLSVTLQDESRSELYYSFSFEGLYDVIEEAIGTGEGEYFICKEGVQSLEGAEILDRGVLQIGEIKRGNTDTYKTTKTYKQYGG